MGNSLVRVPGGDELHGHVPGVADAADGDAAVGADHDPSHGGMPDCQVYFKFKLLFLAMFYCVGND